MLCVPFVSQYSYLYTYLTLLFVVASMEYYFLISNHSITAYNTGIAIHRLEFYHHHPERIIAINATTAASTTVLSYFQQMVACFYKIIFDFYYPIMVNDAAGVVDIVPKYKQQLLM
jgi:hypothetical protein